MPRVTEFVLLWTCSSCAVTYYWVQADETAKPVHAPGADKFTCSGEGVSDPSYAAPPGQGGVDNATASYTYTDLGVGLCVSAKGWSQTEPPRYLGGATFGDCRAACDRNVRCGAFAASNAGSGCSLYGPNLTHWSIPAVTFYASLDGGVDVASYTTSGYEEEQREFLTKTHVGNFVLTPPQ